MRKESFLDFLIAFKAISLAFTSAVKMEESEGIFGLCSGILWLKSTTAHDTEL